MKNISKYITGVCLSAALCVSTSCIDETFPTSGATKEQLGSSAKATEALLWAQPAFMNKFDCLGFEQHYDFGEGAIMHMRDVMTGDMPITYSSSGYDWFENWETNKSMGEDLMKTQWHWLYYFKFIQTANNLIAAVNEETATSVQLGYLGVGHAIRAFAYLEAAQMYEFLPNDGTQKSEVEHLTVPIVRETTTEEKARNNPRATREEMATFILGDLQKAEDLIKNLNISDKVLPHLDVVYGLKARCYMWLGQYGDAKTYARKAIDETSVTPMSEDECLSPTKGFNTLSAWMWGCQLMAEDGAVQTGIINWTSWVSNETYYGYASVEPQLMIDKRMYERIKDTDFRKKLWKAPKGGKLVGKTDFVSPDFAESVVEYGSVKFRPGDGNADEYKVGSATAYPLMRVEEMYLIEAEAAAHLNAGEGKTLLENFMKTYRDAKYATSKTATDEVVEEIVFQKRVELWGEGLTFFDIKRLNYSVERGYPGTNFHEMAMLNTVGRPAWMNLVIVKQEANNNKALVDMNNPDPTDCYTPWSDPNGDK